MEKPIKIALLGANEQQNPLILKAKSLNYETHVFAWQTDNEIGAKTADVFYPISAENKDSIFEKCKEIGISAIISIGSDIAACSCAFVSEQMGLPTTAYTDIKVATNKLQTRKLFDRYHLLQPEYVEISDSFDSNKLRNLTYPLVIKPSDRSGGRGLRIVQNEKQLYRAISKARELSVERKAIVEEYIQGQCYSCECISFGGRHKIVTFTKRDVREVNGKIIEVAHFQPSRLPRSVENKVKQEVTRVLDVLSIKYGASSVEFIIDTDKNCWFIEVSPTMYGDFIGSHLVQAATGYDYLEKVIEVALGKDTIEDNSKNKGYAEVRFICDRNDVEAWKKEKDVYCLTLIEESEIPELFNGTRHGSYLVQKERKAFGGCNSLELPIKKYTDTRFHVANSIALNSEYTALWYVLKIKKIKRLWMPHYMASAWKRAIQELDVEICYYYLTEELSPCFRDLKDLSLGDAVMLVDYFGVCTSLMKDWAEKVRSMVKDDLCIIIDASMAYFTEPMQSADVFTIYSCRKFFGVPDGAYLINCDMEKYPVLQLEKNIAHLAADAQLLALELGETAAYKAMQTNEQELIKQKKYMSRLTEKFMETLVISEVQQRRMRNYKKLECMLNQFQELKLINNKEEINSPQCYPLLVHADIRNELILEKIFVPQMWRRHLGKEYVGTMEQSLATYLLCLPIDQRYSKEDMRNIADTVAVLLS